MKHTIMNEEQKIRLEQLKSRLKSVIKHFDMAGKGDLIHRVIGLKCGCYGWINCIHRYETTEPQPWSKRKSIDEILDAFEIMLVKLETMKKTGIIVK